MEKPRLATSFRLSEVALSLLSKIAAHNGLDRTSALELLIREKADTMGFPRPALATQPKRARAAHKAKAAR
jgi:hypothetical protein